MKSDCEVDKISTQKISLMLISERMYNEMLVKSLAPLSIQLILSTNGCFLLMNFLLGLKKIRILPIHHPPIYTADQLLSLGCCGADAGRV